MLAPLVAGVPAASPGSVDFHPRADVSFNCDCITHWFKHNRVWIRASTTSGCMAFETLPKKVWALNALPKPDYVSKDYPNLVCSLNQNECQWRYSPLDFLSNSSSSDSSARSLNTGHDTAPACEKLSNARELLPPFLPFAMGPATPDEMKLEASLSTKRTEDDDAAAADPAPEESDSDIDDNEDSDSEEEDGDDQDGNGEEETVTGTF